ncbi:MAG: hypothetical protein IPJ34_42900 [Myxococcales bacterium]|nr:hypothetical protein [Myxococcales bacterium]
MDSDTQYRPQRAAWDRSTPIPWTVCGRSDRIGSRVGEMTHVVVETTLDFDTFRALPTPLHHWASVETLVRGSGPKPGGIESLAVVGDGGAFAFVFAGKGQAGVVRSSARRPGITLADARAAEIWTVTGSRSGSSRSWSPPLILVL